MSMKGKEYKLAIRIAGAIDRSFTTSLASANRALRRNLTGMDKDFARLDGGFQTIVGVGKRCFSALATAAGVASAAIGAALYDCTKEASQFEGQMSDVVKYVGGLADEAGKISDKLALNKDGSVLNGKTYAENYQEMKDVLLDLSTKIPKTAEELTKLSAAAGQSGYGIEELFQYDSNGNITGFLKDVAVMGTAMDISAEQAGDWAAKWEKAFNMSHEEIMVLADQINYLGANSATTAAEIAQAVNDAASLGQIGGMDVPVTAALADAMLATGVGSDRVATSIKRTITNLSKGTSATKAMKEQWEELGFTAEGVAIAMQEDSIGTLKEVFEAIGNLPEHRQVAALSTLFGQWAIEGTAKVVGNMSVFQDALDMVNDPSLYTGSMEREFAIKANTDENIDLMVGNAFRAMKIKVGDSFLPIKKEFSQDLIDWIGSVTDKITTFNDHLGGADGIRKWVKEAGTQLPTLQRKFKKFAEPVFSAITGAGRWIIKHGQGIISVIAGIGAAMVTYKVASTATHFLKALLSFGSLNPVTGVILGVVSAVGLVTGAFAFYKQKEQELIDQNLADHFGTIALSMEELQAVAEHILRSESLSGAEAALAAFADLDGIAVNMKNAVSEIDKMNWKVSIGMELTEEEKEAYKQAIDDYVENAQEYALQSQYAVSLNLQIAFSGEDLEGQDVVAKVNQFYQDRYEELSSLGTQLNEAVTEAFNDGLLDIEETKVIADIQRQMAEIEESLATGEFDAQLSVLGMEYEGGGSLTADSFQNLQEELKNQVSAASETYRESYVKNYAAIQAAYQAGDYLNDSEYRSALEGIQAQYMENVSALQARSVNFQIETVMKQYEEELGPAIENYMEQAQEMIAAYTKHGEAEWLEEPDFLWSGMVNEFRNSDLDKTTKNAIGQLLEEMRPSIEAMEEIKQQYEAMGREVPESILKGLSDFTILDAIANADFSSANQILSEQLLDSEYFESFYKDIFNQLDMENIDFMGPVADKVIQAASVVTEENINAAAEETVRPAIEKMYTWAQNVIEEYYSKGFHATAEVAVTLNPKVQFSPINYLPGLRRSGLNIDQNADGGIIRNTELSWLAEEGPEAVIPLDGSRNAVSLWEKTGKLLGMRGAFDGVDLSGGSNEVKIEYRPVLKFYGEAPTKRDLGEALEISQDKFDSMMDRYLKNNSRLVF